LTSLYEQAHCHDGGASLLQSKFQVAFFVLHPTDVSKLPDKNINFLTFRSKYMVLHCLNDKKKKAALLSLASATSHAFLG
jgi:hypothetical protein